MIHKNSPVFKAIVSAPNPFDAERDYIECQILDTIFADTSIGNKLIFSGGATLTKSYKLCDRISRDIDLSCTEFTDLPSDRSRRQLNKFRNNFKEYVFDELRTDIHYAINQDRRFMITTDREWRVLHNPEQTVSYPALHVLYKSILTDTFNHICIEIIPRKYDASAISYNSVVPYSIHTPTRKIPTVAYQQTFWDKVFALHSVATGAVPDKSAFFSRHYFDVAKMSDKIRIDDTFHLFNDTVAYQAKYTTKSITPISNAADICLIPKLPIMAKLGAEYDSNKDQFLTTPPKWVDVVSKLFDLKSRFNNYAKER